MCIIAQSTEFWLYFILVAAGGPRYDIEYKSSRFSKSTTDDEIERIKLQIEKDIYYKGQKQANPCWVFAELKFFIRNLSETYIPYYNHQN